MLHGGLQNTWNQSTPDVGSITGAAEQTWNQSTPDVGDVSDAASATATDGKGWFPTDPVNGVQNAGEDLWAGATGALDDTAGSTDEAVGRQFDSTRGGGVVDGTTDTIAGIADWTGGSVDESIGRQFDNQAGGGFADQIGSTVAGVGDWAAGGSDEAVGKTAKYAKYALIGIAALGVLMVI